MLLLECQKIHLARNTGRTDYCALHCMQSADARLKSLCITYLSFYPVTYSVKMASVLVVRLLAALFYGVSSFMITVANKVVLTSYK